MKIGITSFHFPNWQILVYAESLSAPDSPWPHGAHSCALRKTSKHGTFNLLANGA